MPGADSGTFDYFTEAIVGKAKSSRGDYTASEDDNVLVQGVSRDVNALGYFGYAYYAENQDKLKAVPIVRRPGQGRPSSRPWRRVINGTYQPLSRPIFIYVNATAYERPEVKQFVEFYMKHADALVREVKYVPLPRQGLCLQHRAPGEEAARHQVRRREQGRPHHRGADEAGSQAVVVPARARLPSQEGRSRLLRLAWPAVRFGAPPAFERAGPPMPVTASRSRVR